MADKRYNGLRSMTPEARRDHLTKKHGLKVPDHPTEKEWEELSRAHDRRHSPTSGPSDHGHRSSRLSDLW